MVYRYRLLDAYCAMKVLSEDILFYPMEKAHKKVQINVDLFLRMHVENTISKIVINRMGLGLERIWGARLLNDWIGSVR